MTRKVVYVSIGRLTDKIARDWYIDFLIEKGIPVEYWDVVSLLREEHSEPGVINAGYLYVLRSFAEVESRLRAARDQDVLYVMLIPYLGQFTRIYRLFSRYDCRMAFIAWGALPRSPALGWRRLASAVSKPAWYATELLYRGKARALRKLKLVKPFDVVFAAGRALMSLDHYAARIVPINLCDYDNYLRAQTDERRLVAERYAVFLDINLPYQSDLALCGYAPIEPQHYYESLNRFFDLLERQHGVRVVIAAHPKANYDAATFAGRQVHRLLTAELVKDAELVLCHISTALSYAVLNAKPVIFIYTQGMAEAYQDTVIRQMRANADYLGSAVLNIDAIAPGTDITIRDADAQRYARYKYEFLTSPQSESTATREVFLREILAGTRAGTHEAQWISVNR